MKNLAQQIELLQAVSIFSDSSPEMLEKIAGALIPRPTVAGEVIIKKGEPGDAMYLVASGSVKIHLEEYVFAVMTAHQFFGEYALMDNSLRSASVTAVEDGLLYQLNQADFFAVADNNPFVIRGILKALIKRMVEQNKLEAALDASNRKIELQQSKILESHHYAKRIQDSFLPTEAEIQAHLPESFVLFQPRDIVSGDFYWFREMGDELILAVADCTGHGVPGALLSMVGNSLLQEVIETKGIVDPCGILEALHTGFLHTLKQHREDAPSQDGMDISICVINKITRTLEVAGAKSNAFLISNGRLERLKGDLVSVGGIPLRTKKSTFSGFTKYSRTIEPGMCLYLLSDGYMDQFGGDPVAKFNSVRFKQLLLDMEELPMPQQKNHFLQTLKNWMGDQRQIDDILVLGIRLDIIAG